MQKKIKETNKAYNFLRGGTKLRLEPSGENFPQASTRGLYQTAANRIKWSSGNCLRSLICISDTSLSLPLVLVEWVLQEKVNSAFTFFLTITLRVFTESIVAESMFIEIHSKSHYKYSMAAACYSIWRVGLKSFYIIFQCRRLLFL